MSQLNSFDVEWESDLGAENVLEEASSDSVEAGLSFPCRSSRTISSRARRLIEQHLEERSLRTGLCEVFDEAEEGYQVS